MAMHRSLLVLALLAALFHCNAAQQIQMPEAGALHLPDEELSSQVLSLQKNVSELWSYIYQLRSAVTQHLNHLRQHQVELEDVVHRVMHGHGEGTSAAHTDDHHHSGEQHSHSNEQHSHGDDHHSHSGEHHSHGDDHHSHGDDQHSHGDDHHSHSGEHSHGSSDDHSHGSHGHYHDSHSHSHSHDSHGSHSSHEGGDGHHHHDHKDSHEKEDELQQSQQGADLQQIPQGGGQIVEPLIVPSVARTHHPHQTPGSSFKPLPLMNHHHHHHDHEPRRNRSRVAVLPKYSEYDLYEFAVCNVQPNRAIPEDQQQEITGQITLWQKKLGGSLNLHVRLQGFEMGDHHGHHQQAVQQEDDNETPAPVSHKHGFHVHTSGDLSNGCQSTGAHYNPKSANHGGPNSLVRHVGDLGNIECDEHGVANIVFSDDVASLRGPYSIIGKAIVIHALTDDYGLGGDEESLRTGNAGTRLACCVIQKVEKLPIRSYKAIKTAKQYQN